MAVAQAAAQDKRIALFIRAIYALRAEGKVTFQREPCHNPLARAADASHPNEMEHDLTGQLLIAMPGMGDPRFDHSVVYLCAHSEQGAMGLMINKPAPSVSLGDMLERLEIENSAGARHIVHFGGPVEMARGFVLHSTDYQSEGSTLMVDDHFSMTGTVDILESIANGTGPSRAMVALGYAGWGPGQIEDEMAADGGLLAPAVPDLVFDGADETKWIDVLKQIGIDPIMLSASAGRA